ncbi:GntR family transcriptional regulator [Pollutimonas subterranea]|uniref:GntR family transcriptional regulator n=2 Tax=Pollutimonas subterranea TaxID=2045210 RepID=A0A2N4U3X5_9BURK|nr:GntR family transcriptional regulator [Pollutimonas subterranea]
MNEGNQLTYQNPHFSSRNRMATALSPIDKNTLWDLAYSELKKALLSGKFEPGQRIILREVAGELGISLTPVRDAVNHLIAERVLDRGPGGQKGGASVPHLDAGQFQQLMFLRADLESRLAYAATANISDTQIHRLEQLVEQMKKSIDKSNKNTYLDLHRRFHFSLYEHAHMDVVTDITEILWLRCGPALNAVLRDYVPNLKQTDHHSLTISGLQARNATQVAQSIRNDITEAGEYIFAQLSRGASDRRSIV